MQNDNRNFLIFAVLAVLLLFGWPLVANRIFPPANPPVSKVDKGKTVPLPSTDTPAASTATATRSRDAVLKEGAGQRIAIDTPSLKGSINLKGARIDDLVLTKYTETIDKNSPPIRLLSPEGAADAYFARFGWMGDGVSVPGPDTVFVADSPALSPGKPVTLQWVNANGQRFRIRIAIDDKYMFTVEQQVGNVAAQPVTVQPYGLIARNGIPKDVQNASSHIGPIGVFDGAAKYGITYGNLQGHTNNWFWSLWNGTGKAGENAFDTTGGWIGFGDKYWLAALIPAQGMPVKATFPATDAKTPEHFSANVARAPITIAPGKAVTITTRLFAGAKEVNTIDNYEDSLQIQHFGRAIDWGWFEIIEKPIFKYLDWLFRMIGNFGVAIMLLTLSIRLLIFPIAQRQFASMASMRAIQPKMKALQEKYKDDKARQQQEVMALYKAEGVNPLAGCLPTFLQIPIMYSLYKVLILTIEMRHQPFVGWIKDLSAPDHMYILNLFGYLDFTPPSFLAIGVIPVLLGISMWLQFRLNPQPMDEAQKQVFAFMPWILMFVMAPFAVGLQVYWITSNLLTVLQQKFLYSRHPALKEPVVK